MADMFRDHRADGLASAYERCADRLEEALHAQATEPLTLQKAAEESAYSYSAIQQMVADGRLRNVGEKGKPRVRRADVPKKPQGEAPTRATGEPDIVEEILAAKL